MRWPAQIKAGSVNNDLCQNIDFADVSRHRRCQAPDEMQGESFLPCCKAAPLKTGELLYYHYYEYPGVHNVRRHEGVSGKRFKLIRFYGKDVPNGEEVAV